MKINFNNSFKSTRSGFKHETQLFINDDLVRNTTCHYLNRTWESYQYQSVMKQALSEEIDAEKERLKEQFKHETGRQRVSKSIVFDNEYIQELTKKRAEL